jgi:DNA-binding NtrC family response regulator
VHIEDASVSRRHARLRVGRPITIEDLGSANGTRIGERRLRAGEPVALALGEVVDLGSVLIVVQPESAPPRARRLWPHGYFEARVEEECARAAQSGASLAVARLQVGAEQEQEQLPALLAASLAPADVAATYAPGEYELLLVDVTPAEAEARLARLTGGLGRRAARLGLACFPRDGRTPEALIARAGEAVHGDAPRVGPVIADAAMQRLHRLVERIASGDISVLLLGETGVGKEVLAEVVHRRSPRSAGPFVKLNCAALAPTLLESELFGHERGAFTGAAQAKPGLLETAQGGTVFLDEIGELPLQLQSKLLRVLEERQVMRVGALKARAIDARFIAATNRDLETEVRERRFREDLYFRLNGVSLMIPPLRERQDEIPELARRFIVEACRRLKRRDLPRLGADALAALTRYSWPGNVRELRNAIERAVLLCSDDSITVEHLPVEKMGALLPQVAPAAGPPSRGAALWDDVERVERQRVVDALERCAGNQTRAATLLGISRPTLLSRMDAYGLPRPRKRAERT